jgi:hypothetical protein
MGRFSHEATATDPGTGFVYLTEDASSSALHRFRPVDRDDPAKGGVLEFRHGLTPAGEIFKFRVLAAGSAMTRAGRSLNWKRVGATGMLAPRQRGR